MTPPETVIYGSTCPYCGQVLDLTVSLTHIYDDENVWVDVAPEVDMNPWWGHVDAHRRAADAAWRQARTWPRIPARAEFK